MLASRSVNGVYTFIVINWQTCLSFPDNGKQSTTVLPACSERLPAAGTHTAEAETTGVMLNSACLQRMVITGVLHNVMYTCY